MVIENRYALKLRRIMKLVHEEILRQATFHQDADSKLTPAQIRGLKMVRNGQDVDPRVTRALESKGLISRPDNVWRLTVAGIDAYEVMAAAPYDIAGVRIIAAIRKPVGDAFDEMAAGAQRANRLALAAINPSDLRLGAKLQQFRDANIALMENAGRVYADQVRELLEDPENVGMRVEDLADQIQERADVSQSRAELIARDQTLKYNGQINQVRQENAGVSQYIWNTSHDDRVRPEHAELDGQTFSWSDPPEPGHPGSDYQCRCVALPYFGDATTDEDTE